MAGLQKSIWSTKRDGVCVFRILCALAAGLFSFCPPAFGLLDGQSTQVAPKATPVKVVVDTSAAPEVQAWADKAKALVEKWHPIIADMLKTEGFIPASEVKLVFKNDMKGVAGTSGNTISISADHITRHPDDYGMVVHELTHVLQRYPKFNKENWWLVEGIADYIRYYPMSRRPSCRASTRPKRAIAMATRLRPAFLPGSSASMTRPSSPS
jgi:hypothetical protein